MKRILIATLVGVMAFSVVTLGGFKFGAEQVVDVGTPTYPLTAYLGWDFDAPFINMGPISIAGDFVITRLYNWPAAGLSGLTWFDCELTFGYIDYFDVIVSTSANIDYAPLPLSIDLIAWDFGVEVVGYVNDVLTLNAGVLFNYVNTAVTDVFNTSFYVGFDAEW